MLTRSLCVALAACSFFIDGTIANTNDFGRYGKIGRRGAERAERMAYGHQNEKRKTDPKDMRFLKPATKRQYTVFSHHPLPTWCANRLQHTKSRLCRKWTLILVRCTPVWYQSTPRTLPGHSSSSFSLPLDHQSTRSQSGSMVDLDARAWKVSSKRMVDSFGYQEPTGPLKTPMPGPT